MLMETLDVNVWPSSKTKWSFHFSIWTTGSYNSSGRLTRRAVEHGKTTFSREDYGKIPGLMDTLTSSLSVVYQRSSNIFIPFFIQSQTSFAEQQTSPLFCRATMFFSRFWVTFSSLYCSAVSRTVYSSYNSSIPELLYSICFCSKEGQSKPHNV